MNQIKMIMAMSIVIFAMMCLPFLLLISALVHPVFWVFGRKGTIRNGGKEIIFNCTSFEKRHEIRYLA